MLAGKGFQKVYNLSGGIKAWNGAVAEGPVELNLDMITGDESPSQIVRLAYGMEKSLGEFYRVAQTKTDERPLLSLLDKLASIEDKHKQYLIELYNKIAPSPVTMASFEKQVDSEVMEGGFNIDDFMKQNETFLSEVSSLLDLSMMLETQALDLYLRFAEKTENEQAREVLHKIGDEEKQHLIALANLREQHP
jgi:sulfur-carrier protein adenylyltransferase/sulfurtransferase